MRASVAQFAHFRLLVLGGGSAGLGAAAKFARVLPSGSLAVVEPHETHYYQPGFSLVGGGKMTVAQNRRSQASVTPPNTKWIKESTKALHPEKNTVVLQSGEEVTYDFLVIATGVRPRYDLIKGLPEALKTPGVCSIYLPELAEKTHREIEKFKGGNALFTFPVGPLKCPGAPQKIMYMAEDTFCKNNVRQNTSIHYFTTLPRIFGVLHYAGALQKQADQKNITVHCRHALKEVDAEKKIATFDILDEDCSAKGDTVQMEYSFLHAAPPCLPAPFIKECSTISDGAGFVDVDPATLQSRNFPNVFAIGDTANTPNAKTAAAISSQLKSLEKNLQAAMDGKPLPVVYDGYASCPLLVGHDKVILAEFTPQGPLETLPVDQTVPRTLAYWMKRYLMPALYWHGLIKGTWNGPATIRKILHLGMGK